MQAILTRGAVATKVVKSLRGRVVFGHVVRVEEVVVAVNVVAKGQARGDLVRKRTPGRHANARAVANQLPDHGADGVFDHHRVDLGRVARVAARGDVVARFSPFRGAHGVRKVPGGDRVKGQLGRRARKAALLDAECAIETSAAGGAGGFDAHLCTKGESVW